MKRKFIQFLMLAAVAVTMGTFVACKDTSDDMFVELQNEINELRLKMISDDAALKDALQTQIDNLKQQVTTMKTQLDGMKSCECDRDLMNQTIQALTDRIAALESGKADANLLDAYKQLLDNLKDSYEAYQATVASTYATKQSLQDEVARLEALIANAGSCNCDAAAIWAKLTELEQAITDAQVQINQAVASAQAAQAAAEASKQLAEAAAQRAEDAASTASDALEQAKVVADAAKALADQMKDIVDTNKTLIETHTQQISDIQSQMVTLTGDLGDAIADARVALAVSRRDSIMIERLTENSQEMKETITELKQAVEQKSDSLGNAVNGLEDRVVALESKTDSLSNVTTIIRDSVNVLNEKLNDLINEKIRLMSDSIAANAEKVRDLKVASEKADSILQDQIDKIVEDVDSLKAQVKENTDNINDLFDAVDALKEAIARQITGIEIQKVTNPWFGSFSTPFDISSNVLIAFYGDASNPIFFPSPAGYGPYATVSGNVELSEKDMEMIALCNPSLAVDESNPYIKAGRPLFNRPTGRADGGEVYVTINPNGLDCSGVQLELVNTAHGTSGFNLTPLASTSDVLEFGWTRAGGLYKAGAYVDAATLNKVDKVDIDMDAAKNAAGTLKDMVKESLDNNTVAASKTDLLSLASDMNKVVQSARLNKTLLRAPWTDVNGNQNYTSSRADIAATAVKPLSFETFKDVNVETIPGFERANALLDRVSNSLQNNVNLVFKKLNSSPVVTDIKAINIKKVEIEDLTPEQLALFSVTIDTTFVIDGLKYYLDLSETVNVPVKFSQDVNVPIDIDKEIAIDLSNVEVNTPTIVVTTDIKNSDGSATLLVPVTMDPNDPDSPVLGYAEVPLDMVKVNANASFGEGGKITLDGQAVANLSYHDNQKVTINVDQTVSTTVNIQKWVYFGDYKLDEEGNPIYVGEGNGDAKTFRILITRDLSDAAESLWGSAQSSLGSVNEMLEQVEKVLEDVNDMLDDINKYNTAINNKIDHYIDKVKDYLQNINDKLAGIINSINSRLQPVMFASDDSGIKNLSQTKNYPTKFAGTTLTLTPTTWTMELAVPVCRKHVAVTNVFKGDKSAQGGDAACLTALKAANAGGKNINERLDGQTHDLSLTGLKAGYVYELAYSALDYHGKIATRKFYLTVQ
ncbi:MAG: hypothetical protein ACI3X7_03045 [Bacteroidaceae bacterium]